MKMDRAILGLEKIIAGPKEYREALTGVFVKKGKATAADGYMLVELELPKDEHPNELDQKGVLFQGKRLAEMLRKFKKGAELTAEKGDDGKVRLGDGETTVVIETVVDATFPGVESLFPTNEKTVEISFDAARMIRILEAMRIAGLDKEIVHLSLYGANEYGTMYPILLEGESDAGRKSRALLMPMIKGGGY